MSGSHFRYPGNIVYFLPMQFADCLDGVPSDDRDENDQDRLALGHGKCDCPTSAPAGQIEGLHERRMAGSS